ncbi:GNAT family N-acetyltransferase [Pseudonocardia humida]|uniref:GNAT family N-acetyltransferase n=1 Tax=Pseudonocardia humida TaxID=2800819 RepID=A0ABT0ZUL1_9PSEU|nr:GNAT family N-acetyltransferase [Pseudonocardia humida]MCO1654416.1 GNAT family N-acetyltransferase [Pseudonocardia humida]
MSEVLAATVHRAWAADLEPRTLYEILRLRVDVFVVEQACPYDELDGRDLEPGARHFWLGGHGEPEPVLGCLRLLDEPGGELRIGRLCSARSGRGRGLGRRLMEAALAEVGDRPCVLDSQEHLAGFYRGYGFEVTGPAYDWDGVSHVPMRRGRR